VDAVAGGPRDQLSDGWQIAPAGWAQVSLSARVSARLRWDKTLEAASIQVHADGETVQLRGTVRDLEQRRRAVELAGSTVGVKLVIDELQVPSAP
jgi:osmotically-inducible protein OsmY